MPLFLIKTISTFSHKYTVEADNREQAEAIFDEKQFRDIIETSQKFDTEQIYDIKLITEEEFIKHFDREHDNLAHFTKKEKLRYINKKPKNV